PSIGIASFVRATLAGLPAPAAPLGSPEGVEDAAPAVEARGVVADEEDPDPPDAGFPGPPPREESSPARKGSSVAWRRTAITCPEARSLGPSSSRSGTP